jgi:Mn2+/Fe2+ NRAMP family transporter
VNLPPEGNESSDPLTGNPINAGSKLGESEGAFVNAASPKPVSWLRKTLKIFGPGLVTGAADDDPSGIATYSSVGAQFGSSMLWTMPFIFPFMAAIQEISARMGRVTGRGIAGNMRRFYPAWMLYVIIAFLVIANIINLGADIGAMGAALNLLIGGPALLYCVLFTLVSVLLQIRIPYQTYSGILKVDDHFFVYLRWHDLRRPDQLARSDTRDLRTNHFL